MMKATILITVTKWSHNAHIQKRSVSKFWGSQGGVAEDSVLPRCNYVAGLVASDVSKERSSLIQKWQGDLGLKSQRTWILKIWGSQDGELWNVTPCDQATRRHVTHQEKTFHSSNVTSHPSPTAHTFVQRRCEDSHVTDLLHTPLKLCIPLLSISKCHSNYLKLPSVSKQRAHELMVTIAGATHFTAARHSQHWTNSRLCPPTHSQTVCSLHTSFWTPGTTNQKLHLRRPELYV